MMGEQQCSPFLSLHFLEIQKESEMNYPWKKL